MARNNVYGNGEKLSIAISTSGETKEATILEHTESKEYQIEQQIHEYFGNIEHSVSVLMMGRIAHTEVRYVDFKPLHHVRRDLEQMFPNLDLSSLTRGFSTDSYFAIFDEMMTANEEVFVYDGNDTLRRVSLQDLAEERMYARTFNVE